MINSCRLSRPANPTPRAPHPTAHYQSRASAAKGPFAAPLTARVPFQAAHIHCGVSHVYVRAQAGAGGPFVSATMPFVRACPRRPIQLTCPHAPAGLAPQRALPRQIGEHGHLNGAEVSAATAEVPSRLRRCRGCGRPHCAGPPGRPNVLGQGACRKGARISAGDRNGGA